MRCVAGILRLLSPILQGEASSYQEIALSLGVDDPARITFATDVHEEAVAASAAGWTAVLVVRPGNKPLPEGNGGPSFRRLTTLEELLE